MGLFTKDPEPEIATDNAGLPINDKNDDDMDRSARCWNRSKKAESGTEAAMWAIAAALYSIANDI